jgi:hypothetical protein
LSSKRQIARPKKRRGVELSDGGRLISDEREQLQEILKNLANMLMMSGYNGEDLAKEFASICRRLSARRSTRSGKRSSKIDHMHVISHWYRDPDYLDSVGKPRKLVFAGAQPSLTRLIARVLPDTLPRGVLDSLLQLGAVRQTGRRYEPTGTHVNFDGDRAHWAYWNMKALHSVLQNMVHNLSNAEGRRYLAMAAINPRFPVSELPAFHARISRRALRLLNDIDASMQRLEVSGRRDRTTEAGVFVFSFENPTRSGVKGATTSDRALRKSSPVVGSD